MTVRASLLVAALALLGSGCVPALTAASSTPAGQAAMERAVQTALVRAGLAEAPATGVAKKRKTDSHGDEDENLSEADHHELSVGDDVVV